MGTVRGVMCHHTAGPATGNMPSLRLLIDGTPSLPGPLSQLGLGRDGTVYVIAAGRCNHAGGGNWQGITTGNSSFIGIEAENTGKSTDPWPEIQMDAYRRTVAALLSHIGADPLMCCGHKEYRLPQGQKIDPTFDMAAFRRDVGAIMAGTAPGPSIIPNIDSGNRPTLRRGDRGARVEEVQRALGTADDGVFGGATEAAVRQFQRDQGLVADGIVGPRTWAALDQVAQPA